MKIALTHFDLTTESGDPKHLLSIAQGLQRIGHKVIIYCAEFKPESCFPRLNRGLDIRTVSSSISLASFRGGKGVFGKMLKRFRQSRFADGLVRRMAETIEPDVDFLIIENDPSYRIASLYRKVNPRVKIIWIMHNPPFFHSPKRNVVANVLSRIAAFFEKRTAQLCGKAIDWILVFDHKTKLLADQVGPPVKLVYLPADIDYFHAPVKHRIPGDKTISFISLGALSPTRRFEDTIAAAVLLREKGFDARVTLICKDYWADKTYRAAFETFIKESGIESYIDARFSGSTEEALRDAIRANDIFVLPNNVQVWAIGACEAMAAGLPLIISRATATAEALHDGVDALFVDALHPEQIAEKAELLVTNPEVYEQIAVAGQSLVEKMLSVERYVQEMLSPASKS